MKAKKILAMIVATALCMGSFAACTGGGSSESSADGSSGGSSTSVSGDSEDSGNSSTAETSEITFPLEETAHFTAWGQVTGGTNPALGMIDNNDNEAFARFCELTNVEVEWQTPPAGQQRENFNLMVSSGIYPDFIDSPGNYYVGGLDKAISDGFLLRLNELMETYAPDYMELINSNETILRDATTDGGNIGMFYQISYPSQQGPFLGYTIRQDWLDDLGLDVPITYDDWHEVLTAFKNEKGATAPLWINYRASDNYSLLSAGYGVASLGTANNSPFFQVDGEVKYGPLEDGYEQYVTMLAQWYSEGLIDPDFYTRTTDMLVPDDLAGTGASGIFPDVFTTIESRSETSVDTSIRMTALPAPVQNEGDTLHLMQYNDICRREGYGISTACENPELAVAWMNLGSVEEYSFGLYYGVEGETYVMEDNEPILTDMILDNPEFSPADCLYKYTFRMPGMYRWDRELQMCGEKGLEAIDIWASNADNTYMMPFALTLTTEEGNEFARMMGDIDTYAAETTVSFILGDEPLENFDTFRQTLIDMGIEDAIALEQAALDRYYNR